MPPPALNGLDHVTRARSDPERPVAFYRDLPGAHPDKGVTVHD
jgi:catechol 2,3-dioxygenase-like lactoylglutathione lyase family enzyme